jgi:hypothetical protein
VFKEPDALQKSWAELAETAEMAVGEILTAKQRKRLDEISLQQRGGSALSDPQVAEALKLTEKQQQQIQATQLAAAKEMQDLALEQMKGFFDFNGNPLAMQNALEKMRKNQQAFQKLGQQVQQLSRATSEKLLNVLTQEQKTKWKELTGKPFRSRGSSHQP